MKHFQAQVCNRGTYYVVDLADGPIEALPKTEAESDFWSVKLGTSIGFSVLDMVKAFEKASEKAIPYKIFERRVGDVAACYANPKYVKELGNILLMFLLHPTLTEEEIKLTCSVLSEVMHLAAKQD